jgi:ppGpp synthetase/RelA/SpoT-type nucleotidyltranferase
MPLPVTKGELNRLGARLIASDRISDADLEELAVVLHAYQQVLDRVKAHLRSLGFSAKGRVKTTGTLTDKLRRSRGMQLSRMQDLAGARIVVLDLMIQDEATETIRNSWEDQGCPCRVVDRRTDPSFGYRAVHIVVHVDTMPVEIQIRTELQDLWAQIVERLGDRWGRGIRYGDDPEHPEAMVRSGELVTSRRDALALLMTLSEALATAEVSRLELRLAEERLASLSDRMRFIKDALGVRQVLTSKIPAEMTQVREKIVGFLSRQHEPADKSLLGAGADMTWAQLVRLTEICQDIARHQNVKQTTRLQRAERQLRDILQLMADATDEGE